MSVAGGGQGEGKRNKIVNSNRSEHSGEDEVQSEEEEEGGNARKSGQK